VARLVVDVADADETVEIRWLTRCQGLMDKCSDFELYSVVNRKLVNVTESVSRSLAQAITEDNTFCLLAYYMYNDLILSPNR